MDEQEPPMDLLCKHCGALKPFLAEETVGKRLWQSRTAIGCNQKEMAKRMRISSQYLGDLERGRRNWSASRVQEYLAILVVLREGKHG